MAKRLLSLMIATGFLATSAPALAKDGLVGEWRNTNDSVHMRVEPCGAALCGKVTWANESQQAQSRKGSGKDLVGQVLLRDLRGANSQYRGKVYIPAINSNANATVRILDQKTLRISGCVVLGVVCRTQHWHRIG